MPGTPPPRRNSLSAVNSKPASPLRSTSPTDFYAEAYPGAASHNGSPWASPERPGSFAASSSVNPLQQENDRLRVELAEARQLLRAERFTSTEALERSRSETAFLKGENAGLRARLDQWVKERGGADEANRLLRTHIAELRQEIATLTAEIDALNQKNRALEKSERKQGRNYQYSLEYCAALVIRFAKFASEMSNQDYSRAARILTNISVKIAEDKFVLTMGEDFVRVVQAQLTVMRNLLPAAPDTSVAGASESPVSFFQNDSEVRVSSTPSAQQAGCGPNSPERRL